MGHWIECSQSLPEIIYADDGSVNSVLVLYEDGAIECGSRIQVANTVWLHGRWSSAATHWMPLPDFPSE